MKTKGLTLPELVVAVTVIVVLSTSLLLAFWDSGIKARNAVRLDNLQNLNSTLDYFELKSWKYLEPEDYVYILNWTDEISKQWYAWSKIKKSLKLEWDFVDPTTKKPYIYSLWISKKWYQFLALFEKDSDKTITQVSAKSDAWKIPYSLWSDIGVLLKTNNSMPLASVNIQTATGYNAILTEWKKLPSSQLSNMLTYDKNCKSLLESWVVKENWTYKITPKPLMSFDVYCDMENWWVTVLEQTNYNKVQSWTECFNVKPLDESLIKKIKSLSFSDFTVETDYQLHVQEDDSNNMSFIKWFYPLESWMPEFKMWFYGYLYNNHSELLYNEAKDKILCHSNDVDQYSSCWDENDLPAKESFSPKMIITEVSWSPTCDWSTAHLENWRRNKTHFWWSYFKFKFK